ncbi:MAG: aldose epimerase family protein [candidate division KSB1 bacterium]|nr:aldose epimerase family protein [candidate division KSB1 bacterium]
MKFFRPVLLKLALLMLVAVSCTQQSADTFSVTQEPFGTLPDGREVVKYTLSNYQGMSVSIINYGAIVTHLRVPDNNGEPGDVVLGYDSLQGYLDKPSYFGATIGRYGNRIDEGRFTLDGKTYELATNNGPNHLHGGNTGFDKVLWTAKPVKENDKVSLVLNYVSEDGEEGYPGTLKVETRYTLFPDNTLELEYKAVTDKKTICNLTNHSYFNLKDAGASPILGHELYVNADHFTPVDSTLIPTGEIRPVEGTPFDFTDRTAIGSRINADNTQLEYGNGYDHNFVLNADPGEMKLAARLIEPETGRVLEVHTQEPGLQFYSGNFLDGSVTGKNATIYEFRHALCLETQHFPDSPNQPAFPSTVLTPDDPYHTVTKWVFRVMN